jgi:glutamate synthase domain-containing protein 1
MHDRSLYPLVEREDRSACGTGFIVEASGRPSRRVVTSALDALGRLVHRGATAADDETGDGAGLLTDLPGAFFREILEREIGASPGESEVPAVAMAFVPVGEEPDLERVTERAAARYGMRYLGRRAVPVRPEALGDVARSCMPSVVQLFVACPTAGPRPVESELYLLRRAIERELGEASTTCICSLSSKTIVYKGLLTPRQLEGFYPDLTDERWLARVALFHHRFATNTLPSWSLAQPFRLLAHNGEINTIRGNRLWMRAREREMHSPFWGEDLATLLPITGDAVSDSASFDHVLEFLHRSGRDLCHSLMLMVPDPYHGSPRVPPALRDFFVYHENVMEPWDGPAALVFTDGEVVGAKLDRNALRPLRYTETRDGLVIMASEAGVVDVEEDNLVHNRHMGPGEIYAVRLDGGGVRTDGEIKAQVACGAPYGELVRHFAELERGGAELEFGEFALPPNGFDRRLRIAFGWHKEEIAKLLLPMSQSGREPIGSMGDDTPPAVQTGVCPGDESAHRSDPRGVGDRALQVSGHGGQPVVRPAEPEQCDPHRGSGAVAARGTVAAAISRLVPACQRVVPRVTRRLVRRSARRDLPQRRRGGGAGVPDHLPEPRAAGRDGGPDPDGARRVRSASPPDRAA